MNIFLNLGYSLFFLIISLLFYCQNKLAMSNKKTRLYKIVFAFFFFISYSLSVVFYAIDNITGNGINQSVIYFLKFGIGGSGFMDFKEIIIKGVLLLILGLVFTIYFYILNDGLKNPTIVLFQKFVKNRLKFNGLILLILSLVFLIISILINPITKTLISVYIEKPQASNINSDFYNYYNVPDIKKEGESKNFVFIYLESLEYTYFDENVFPGLVDNLKKIEEKSISFTNIKQDDYSHHTTAGIVASQCGLPLISPVHVNYMYGMDTFMQSANCLGDILHNEDYFLSYYNGANINFAGKDLFLKTHSFNDILGYNELAEKSNIYKNSWGLYDDSLLDLSKKEIEKLDREKEKFAFFMLTIDTHHPKGNSSKSCEGIIYGDGTNSILNSVKCSDILVSNFVNDLRKTDYGKDLIIIIASDHLAVQNNIIDTLKKQNRTNLFLINTPETNKNGGEKNNTAGLTLDTGTTLLPFIGYSGNIGLGRNLNLKEESNTKRVNDYLEKISSNNWSPEVLKFWNFPRINNSVKIMLNKKQIYIGKRTFQIPLMLELDNDLNTMINFQIYDTENTQSRYPHLFKLSKNTPYMIVDKCLLDDENPKTEASSKYISNKFCLTWGRKDVFSDYKVLDSDTELSRDHIMKLINQGQ